MTAGVLYIGALYVVKSRSESWMLQSTMAVFDMVCNTLYLAIFPALLTPWSCTFPANNTHPVVSATYGTEHEALCYAGDGWTAMAVVSAVTVPLYVIGSGFTLMALKCDPHCAEYLHTSVVI